MNFSRFAMGSGVALIGIIFLSKRVIIPIVGENTDLVGVLFLFVGIILVLSEFSSKK